MTDEFDRTDALKDFFDHGPLPRKKEPEGFLWSCCHTENRSLCAMGFLFIMYKGSKTTLPMHARCTREEVVEFYERDENLEVWVVGNEVYTSKGDDIWVTMPREEG